MEIPAPDFDLALTLDSGQTFHWEPLGKGFVGAIEQRAVYVEQRGERAELPRRAGENRRALLRARSSAGGNLRVAAGAIRRCRRRASSAAGCASCASRAGNVSPRFITSSMKQVAHIRQISRTLRERFGMRQSLGELHLYSYPQPEVLADLHEDDLRHCALGYRAKNLLATAQLVASGDVDLEALAALPDDELRAALCALPGVGAKVANCVMLFAYERLQAFPIDVWVERVLREKYFPRRRKFRR